MTTTSITIQVLPNGIAAFQVGGLFFARVEAAERFAANLMAKIARHAAKAVAAVKATVQRSKPAAAVRLRVAARKADVLASRAKGRASDATAARHAALSLYSPANPLRAMAYDAMVRAGKLHRAAVNRADRLWKALEAHVNARLTRTA